MTNDQVMKTWESVPAEVEVAVRRLKLLQQMCLFPKSHVQTMHAILRQMRNALTATVDNEGNIIEHANPWAKQFQEAFEHVNSMDLGRDIYDDADGSCYIAITKDGLKQRFTDMDVTELRWRWIRAQVPPLGWQQRDEEQSGDEEVTTDEDEPLNYVCQE